MAQQTYEGFASNSFFCSRLIGNVAQVRQPETVKVANYIIERLGKATVTAELLHPDELVSGMISQIAATPEMAELLAGFIYTYEGAAPCQPFNIFVYMPISKSQLRL